MAWDNSTVLTAGFLVLNCSLVFALKALHLWVLTEELSPCRAPLRGTRTLQCVTTEWITIGSDSNITSILQTFIKHLYFHHQLRSPQSTTVRYQEKKKSLFKNKEYFQNCFNSQDKQASFLQLQSMVPLCLPLQSQSEAGQVLH